MQTEQLIKKFKLRALNVLSDLSDDFNFAISATEKIEILEEALWMSCCELAKTQKTNKGNYNDNYRI